MGDLWVGCLIAGVSVAASLGFRRQAATLEPISRLDRLIWQVLPFGPLLLGAVMIAALIVY
jgi:hypothetical protein